MSCWYLFYLFVLLSTRRCISNAEFVTEGTGCVANHRLVKAIEIVSPEYDAIITTGSYYARTAATVTDIQQFQSTNSDYSFCIRTYLIDGESLDVQPSLPLVFEQCGLEVFDEHIVQGFSTQLASGVSNNQSHLFEISLYHVAEGLLCQGRRLVTVMRVDDSAPLKSTDSVKFIDKETLKFDAFVKYISSSEPHVSLPVPHSSVGVTIAVGIKSSALNAELRQSIRETWLREARALQKVNIAPYFIIGDSPYSSSFNSSGTTLKIDPKYENNHAKTIATELRDTVALFLASEQRHNGDTLLSDVIPVEDSYFTLPQKILHFMKYLSEQTATPDYVLICDDDVFVDVEELESFIVNSAEKKQFYAGEVLEYRNKHIYKPMRDPQHANYLDPAQYPSSVLPPFALGNFYFLSWNVASYLAVNSHLLKSVGTLEDLSVGVWLMSLQVFPRHLSGVCTPIMCLYDRTLFVPRTNESSSRILAVSGIRSPSVYRCFHDHITKRKSNGNEAEWYTNYYSLMDRVSQGQACADPATLKENVPSSKASVEMILMFTPNTMYALPAVTNLLTMQASNAPLVRVKLQCYQLNVDQVFASEKANIWSSVVRTDHNIELELPSDLIDDMMLVTGILDCGAIAANMHTDGITESQGSGIVFDSVLSNDALHHLIHWVKAYNVWFISGEPADLSSLRVDAFEEGQQVKLTVVNTVTNLNMQVPVRNTVSPAVIVNNLYYPNFMTAVDEMSMGPPSAPCYSLGSLLKPLSYDDATAIFASKSDVVAYLYHRCDRMLRETFFRLLTAKLISAGVANGVTALGDCNGSGYLGDVGLKRQTQTLHSRFSSNYMQEAINVYRQFKFVIAFENTHVDGYITEKLTNAFFAHSIPIYLGAPDVVEYFNPRAMINCNTFSSLDECADKVVSVHRNHSMYLQMLTESPIVNDGVVTIVNKMKQC